MIIAWGNNKTATLQLHEYTNFADFCGSVQASCKPGEKEKAIYFIRGGELKDNHRNDYNLISSELIIADIDNTKTKPDVAHRFLKSKNLTHFIYTTTSHTNKKFKYRIILPYRCYNKEECTNATKYLSEILTDKIQIARESYVWSQEWFVSVAPKTGTWYHQGEPLSVPVGLDGGGEKNSVAGLNGAAEATYAEHIAEMLRTGDGHNHYAPMALALSNMGMSEKNIFKTIQPLAKLAFQNHNREWDVERDGNLWASITSATNKIEKENPGLKMPSIEHAEIIHSDEYPPGAMGELVKEFEKMSYYPNKHIAMAGAITFIAGIIGRSFNMNGMGMNLYTTALMDSGRGKDFLNKVIINALSTVTPTGNMGSSFIGSTRFTGPKAVWNDLETGMCKISVMTEAGIMNGSRVGDKENLERTLLNMYTSSGKNHYMKGERYSAEKDSLKTLHSPSLSIIQESTPEVFIRNLKNNDGDIRGELARMWIIRVGGDKPHINRKRAKNFSKKMLDRIRELVIKCGENQGELLKIIGDYHPTEHMYIVGDKYVDLENRARRDGETLKRTMATRAFAKALKIGSIIDIFNKDEPQDSTFDWVCQHIIDVEADNINVTFHDEDNSEIMTIIENKMVVVISKMLNNKYNDLKKVPAMELRKRGIFTKYNLQQCVRGARWVNEFNVKKGGIKTKSGIDVIIDYMLEQEMLIKISPEKLNIIRFQKAGRPNTSCGYKITESFLDMIEMTQKIN